MLYHFGPWPAAAGKSCELIGGFVSVSDAPYLLDMDIATASEWYFLLLVLNSPSCSGANFPCPLDLSLCRCAEEMGCCTGWKSSCRSGGHRQLQLACFLLKTSSALIKHSCIPILLAQGKQVFFFPLFSRDLKYNCGVVWMNW